MVRWFDIRISKFINVFLLLLHVPSNVTAHFRNVDDTTATYPKFLVNLRDVIFQVPPYTEDWSGLDGIWYERYLKEARSVKKQV